MGRKKTTEQFIEELKIVNPEITVIDEYVNSKTKIKIQHTCGNKWKSTPDNLLNGNSCPKCSKIKTSKKRSKTTEQFSEELKIVNPEITLFGEYVNSKTKIEVQHTCGYQWEITPNNLLKGTSCPKCSKIKTSKKRSKTTEQFSEELKIVNPEITLLGKYVGSLTKIEVKHSCGYEWKAVSNSLLRGIYCPKCSGKIKKTTKQFIKELKIINPEITVIGKYINSMTKIKIQHTCGNKWEAIPNNLLNGNSCPKCSKIKTSKKRAKTTKQFIEELKGVNSEITVIGNYINSQTKIEVKHSCGYEWKAVSNSLLRGIYCPKCSGKIKKTTKQFIEELKMVNPEITVIGEYINSRTKIEVKHSCGYEWEAIPIKLRQGTSCPRCNEPKGEKFLSKVLKSNNIPFVSQFNLVKNPKTNYWLRSDFAILNKEKEPILIIEYDGEQHFKSVDYFGGEEALKATKYRDSIKDEYCKENNIPFLRFNYKQSENDITDLLLKQLKKMKLI